MTAKIIRGDGTTELSGIKTCTYTERVNAGQDLRPGCVASAFINVTVYGSQSTAPTVGEALKYYQVDSGGNETLIGTFYAEPSIPSRNTYAFVAYDAVSKLDADFSDWLASNQSNFPMTMYNLVSAACSVAGVTLGSSSWLYSTRNINAFYADGITCRNILEYSSELSCNFVRCNSTGAVIFDWYSVNSTGISPSGSQTTVAYKQDGLNYDNYTAEVDAVSVYPVGVDSAAYTYPSGTTGNILRVTNNALLYGATSTMMTNNARTIYSGLDTIGSYRPAMIHLFPFENPFRAGDIVTVTDIQGVTFQTVIMAMTVTESVATIESYGHEEVWNERNTAREAIQLAADAVRFNHLIANKADVDMLNVSGTAIANRIDVETLMAKNLTATGVFQVNNSKISLSADDTGVCIKPQSWSSQDFRSSLELNHTYALLDAPEIRIGHENTAQIAMRTYGPLNVTARGVLLSTQDGVTVAGGIKPVVDGSGSLGSSSSRWANVYSQGLNLSGTAVAGGTVRPNVGGGSNLGTSSYRWGTVYANAVNIAGYAPVCRRSKTVTGTTNSNGNIALNIAVDSFGVLCVHRSDATSICTPYYPTTVTSWYAHVATTAGAAVTNTSVTLEVEYYYKNTV